jgi:hypothetical protein
MSYSGRRPCLGVASPYNSRTGSGRPALYSCFISRHRRRVICSVSDYKDHGSKNVQRLLEKYFGSQIPCDVMTTSVWSLVSWYSSVTNRS